MNCQRCDVVIVANQESAALFPPSVGCAAGNILQDWVGDG